MNKYYITCAIPYVNAPPHIGHALEFVQTDAIARFNRLLGKKTTFLTGADENSLKNVKAAEKEGISTKKLCDINSQKFQDLLKNLNVSIDIFQRGTDKIHITGSQILWQLCAKSGDIYKKKYRGLYCIGCEAFYNQDELDKNGLCPEHLTIPELIEEENYFFRLSKYQKFLEEQIYKNKIKIIPQIRKNEVVSFINKGLHDFSISRSVKRAKNWGVPVPNDPTQVIYVWFDALNIYQTGIGFGTDEKKYKTWWPADLHVIGKGISRFHAIFWPAILKSANLDMPKEIFIHGYVTCEGQKMSKTLGNIINPQILIEKYGIDPVRYYLLREIPAYQDGDFSQNRFKELYNADLANGLGNLVARVAKLCEKSGFDFDNKTPSFSPTVEKYLQKYQFPEALSSIWLNKEKSISSVDKLINDTQPWKLKGNTLEKVLTTAVSTIRHISCNLQPFLPQTAQKILSQFTGPKITCQPPLFPRLK